MSQHDLPHTQELPSTGPTTAQLLRATFAACAAAVVIFVTVVLPAEFGIDPTRVGTLLGLTEMGQIKTQLAAEAEADHHSDAAPQLTPQRGPLGWLTQAFVPPAQAQDADLWTDEISFTLAPGEGVEWKLRMEEGALAQFRWVATGGRVNFDLHGHANGESITYEKGRGAAGAEGGILAAFDGLHGWFWRNRDTADVTITLQVGGNYIALENTH